MSLTTDCDIDRAEREILDAVSAGYIHSYVKGILLGTGLLTPQIVTVPLRPGLHSYRSLDDLFVRMPLPVNLLIGGGVVMDQPRSPLLHHGNILIIKHAKVQTPTPVFDILDITQGDYVLIKPILECRVNTEFGHCVRAVYRARAAAVVDLAFPTEQHASFWYGMESHHSYIGGSAAYWIVDSTARYSFSNINILAPLGTLDKWCRWLTTLGCKELFLHDFRRRNFTSCSTSIRVFATPKGIIMTVTESNGSSVIPLMLNGDSTAECVAVGCHIAYILYPTLVDNNVVLPLATDVATHHLLQSLYGRRHKFYYNTRDLGEKCRESCPALWRSADGFGIEKFRWGNAIYVAAGRVLD
ncbi:hypothetical protein GG344DRAFT_71493 [Lentinula edodes]|nr:hypothetical protein GG344DRAFT_71493 [Lentinula edodes]